MILETNVWETLRQVVDPEIDCNVVDLGLVYGVAIDGAKVTVTMTLTTSGCPMHESIARGVENALLNLEDVDEVEVRIVWDPPWSPERMSPYGRELRVWVDEFAQFVSAQAWTGSALPAGRGID